MPTPTIFVQLLQFIQILIIMLIIIVIMVQHYCFGRIMSDFDILDDMFRYYSAIDEYIIIESEEHIAIQLNFYYLLILLHDIDHQYVKPFATIHRVYDAKHDHIDCDLVEQLFDVGLVGDAVGEEGGR